jgi:dihydrofolate reductase
MARLIFGMNVSLDGYVDHDKFSPDPVLFRYFVEDQRGLTGSVYGSRMYEIMRYWDPEDASWGAEERDFAEAWRKQPKWVVSKSMTSVGPHATLVTDDAETAVRRLKAEHEGDIEIAGTRLAHSLAGLIDEYRLYVHPVVLGGGTPYFAGPRPPLRLTGHERIGEQAIRLTYMLA